MATPNLSEIITSTLRSRSGKLADNVSKGNAILNRTKEKGGWKPASGRTILQELEYNTGNYQWYSGYDAINISPADVFTSAEFNWKQLAASISASGLEIEVQNVGKEAIIDLLEARIKNAEKTLKNQLTIGMYADGTASNGNIVGGTQLLVANAPTTGVVGGIDRSVWSFWRNQKYSGVTDGGAAVSATNIQKYMNALFLLCTRGTDKPDLIIADSAYYNLFWQSLQAIQRVMDPGTAKASAGFTALAFGNTPVVFEDSTGMPANQMYFLNTEYLFLRYAPRRMFTPLERVQSINQDAIVQILTFAGNMTVSNASLQGTLIA